MENMANLSNDNVVKRNVNSLPPVPAFVTKESYQHAGSFLPQPTDIFVNCPPKCGTTWMSQIVHQLRSGGDMSFNDIDEVVLWIDTAYTFGDVIDKEQTYHPRIFKSHMSYKTSPKGHFYISGEMTIETFISDIYKKKIKELMDYFEHLRSWWPRRNDSNVLMLTYEDMSNDLESAVRSVATFVGITDEGSIRNAVKMSSFDFMKIHKDKFNMSIYLQNLQRIGYLGTSLLERVATGSATKGREMMSEQAKQAIQNMWNESITSTIGLKNYEEFCTALNNEKHQ
ncbi:sulfotransferase ssu-1-like [Xenia sp. Carnegie-2017]|uniref:sulfotransferase ssu-1-like n=1 Tax=Xenia sp. Carnegie-2017 TaxID=2897299 RepID=UPI001F0427E5|nr:sulfotransferase ssu-1-like [Xenia sp. Carnegie-2017]